MSKHWPKKVTGMDVFMKYLFLLGGFVGCGVGAYMWLTKSVGKATVFSENRGNPAGPSVTEGNYEWWAFLVFGALFFLMAVPNIIAQRKDKKRLSHLKRIRKLKKT